MKKGYNPASDCDRVLRQIENALCIWKSSEKASHPIELYQTPQSQLWNEVVASLRFGYHRFSLTRYRISGISSECRRDSTMGTFVSNGIQKKGHSTHNQTNKMPDAWLDMMDKANMFPRQDAHEYFRCLNKKKKSLFPGPSDAHDLYRCYGLKEFIVLTQTGNKCDYSFIELLFSLIEFVARNCKCQIPLFMKDSCSYKGILECPSFPSIPRTFFDAWGYYNSGIDMNVNGVFRHCRSHLRFRGDEFQGIASASALINYHMFLKKSPKYFDEEPSVDLTSTANFVGCEDHWRDYNIEFYLRATWLEQLETVVMKLRDYEADLDSDFDPLLASKWSVQVKFEGEQFRDFTVPLGDCLKRFLYLCSSTQTESLLNPQISSMLKYRRIYKQREEDNTPLAMQGSMETKVRKVTSKLILKLEESVIPVESINVILDFLFCDAKLQPLQHSNGSNPSTTTTVEDDVEDKFFLSYEEISKYFKLAQPYSLTSRLAICLCAVNKYHGGLGAVKQLWGEFVLEMKYCLENNCEIKGLEPVEQNLDYPELLQNLQMLNSCIKKKKARDASSPITDTSAITEISNGEFVDISEVPLLGPSNSRVAASTIGSLLRVQMLLERLLAKDAFRVANPGCVVGDFARWCATEDWMEEMITDEGKDKTTNEDQRIKISDGMWLVFEKNFPKRFHGDDDDAKKVLHWLASVKLSDLVLKLMPVLLYSAVTTFLKHPVCQLGFLREHLAQFRNKLIDHEAPQCTSSGIKILEDQVHHLTLIEQRMATTQCLLNKIIHAAPSCVEPELEKYISDVAEFSEVPINTPEDNLPSSTTFGKLICKLFKKETESDAAQVEKLSVYSKEYISVINCSKSTNCFLRLHSIANPYYFQVAAAFSND